MSSQRDKVSLSALRDQVRRIVDSLLTLEAAFLQGAWQEVLAQLDLQRRSIQDQGLWGLSLPTKLGGHGLALHEFAVLAEEMGRSPLAHYAFGCQAPEVGNIELLDHFASPRHKAEVLPALVQGSKRSCFAMTERRSSGANPTLLQTVARAKGSKWVIDGEKWFTSAADGADYCIVMAVTDPEAPPHRRASLFLLPLPLPGLRIVRTISVMGHAGHGPFSHCELAFENCEVPADSLIGEVGDGFRLAQARLAHGRIHHCARWLGIAQRSLDMLCERAAQRHIGQERLLADSDVIKSWIAESAAEIAAARLLVHHTAALIESGGGQAARTEISMLKYYSAGVLSKALDRAVQAHGAAGVSDDFILAYFYREERAARIYDGPDEVHKLSVARQLLKPWLEVAR